MDSYFLWSFWADVLVLIHFLCAREKECLPFMLSPFLVAVCHRYFARIWPSFAPTIFPTLSRASFFFQTLWATRARARHEELCASKGVAKEGEEKIYFPSWAEWPISRELGLKFQDVSLPHGAFGHSFSQNEKWSSENVATCDKIRLMCRDSVGKRSLARSLSSTISSSCGIFRCRKKL